MFLDLITLGQAAGVTDIAELGAKNALKVLGKAFAVEFASNATATAVASIGDELGLPVPITLLLSMVSGVTVSRAGTKLTIEGATIKKELDISQDVIGKVDDTISIIDETGVGKINIEKDVDADNVVKDVGEELAEQSGNVKPIESGTKAIIMNKKIKLRVADGTILDEMAEKIGKYRGKLPSGVKNSGDFAYANVNINGCESSYYASSAIDSLDDYASLAERVPDISVQPKKIYYEAIEAIGKNGDVYLRDSCTEYKIINNIAETVNVDGTGKIILFTELEPCDSCKNVVNNFFVDHPNIEIEIIHNNGKRIKAVRE